MTSLLIQTLEIFGADVVCSSRLTTEELFNDLNVFSLADGRVNLRDKVGHRPFGPECSGTTSTNGYLCSNMVLSVDNLCLAQLSNSARVQILPIWVFKSPSRTMESPVRAPPSTPPI